MRRWRVLCQIWALAELKKNHGGIDAQSTLSMDVPHGNLDGLIDGRHRCAQFVSATEGPVSGYGDSGVVDGSRG